MYLAGREKNMFILIGETKLREYFEPIAELGKVNT